VHPINDYLRHYQSNLKGFPGLLPMYFFGGDLSSRAFSEGLSRAGTKNDDRLGEPAAGDDGGQRRVDADFA
jgi:hypothetical protein